VDPERIKAIAVLETWMDVRKRRLAARCRARFGHTEPFERRLCARRLHGNEFRAVNVTAASTVGFLALPVS
jgi:hypothetical protein